MSLKNLIKFKDARFIFDVLIKNDKNARFVGGCVRDMLLKREAKDLDIDIGTTLHPSEIEKIFSQYPDIKVIEVGKEYGTVMIVVNHHTYEITTLRRDVHTDGRYAVVEYTNDWEEDAARRDFTINGMSYSPYENKFYDYFGGQEDLKIGLIKFIGDPHKRVEEDYLRILRLFRFYTYYGKTIDPASLAACKKYAKNMERLSQERKMNELHRILLNKDYMETLELMQKNKIIEHVSALPDWKVGIKLCDRLENICSNYGCKFSVILKIFALFYRKDMASSRIAKEFITLSKEEKKYLTALTQLVNSITLKDLINRPHHFFYHYSEILLDGFLYLQAKTSKGDGKKDFNKIARLVKHNLPLFPLTGEDLMSQLSLKQGKGLGEAIELAKNFWIESEFKASKEMILEHIKKILANNLRRLKQKLDPRFREDDEFL